MPLFALAKQIQWNWPDSVYGEDRYLFIFGGLHIASAALKVIGDFLSVSGWASIMYKADVVSRGYGCHRVTYICKSYSPNQTCP